MENKRNLKRKLERGEAPSSKGRLRRDPNLHENIEEHVSFLSSPTFDYDLFTEAVALLSQLAAEDESMVKPILDCGAVPALVRHLYVPTKDEDEDEDEELPQGYHYEMAKECALLIELLATEPEYQQHIVDAGALPPLISLLERYRRTTITVCPRLVDLLRRVLGAITSLAHENNRIKTLVRLEEGVYPLVQLLAFKDIKVKRAAARALRTIAFNNEENKVEIVRMGALSNLVTMLQAEDPKIASEAVGVIGNLVHSSPKMKEHVLFAGALQPVIRLLSSSCSDSQREAALLIGQFATADSECKAHIAQRGAIPPLIKMLKFPDAELREMSSFALGRLAQDTHNQAGIAYHGGIEPLLKLLDSSRVPIQHNAAFAIYGLADNEDVVADLIKAGTFQKLKNGLFRAQQTRECVAKTLMRLERMLHGPSMNRLMDIVCFAEESVQRLVVIALAFLCPQFYLKPIFVDNNGLTLLLDILKSPSIDQKADASAALHSLANKAGSSISLFDAAPVSPTPQMYLGEEYVNNPNQSDVTFLVEGKHFYAHRNCLLSSDIFRAMFDGGYKETKAKHIVIPDIKWDVFELMMRFLYTGTVDVKLDVAQDLLKAADQYLLDGLKRFCEYALSQELSDENVLALHAMSVDFNATALKHSCILFMLKNFHTLCFKPWYFSLVRSIIPDIQMFFSTLLTTSRRI